MIITAISSILFNTDAYIIQLSDSNIDYSDSSYSFIEDTTIENYIERNTLVNQLKSLQNSLSKDPLSTTYKSQTRLVIDNVFDFSHSGTAETPTHPVESGVNVINHKFAMPEEITMTIGITGKGWGALGYYVDLSGLKSVIIRQCESSLTAWKNNFILLDIYGKYGIKYENYTLVDFKTIDNARNYNLYEAQLKFKQAPQIEKTYVTSSISSITSSGGQASAEVSS